MKKMIGIVYLLSFFIQSASMASVCSSDTLEIIQIDNQNMESLSELSVEEIESTTTDEMIKKAISITSFLATATSFFIKTKRRVQAKKQLKDFKLNKMAVLDMTDYGDDFYDLVEELARYDIEAATRVYNEVLFFEDGYKLRNQATRIGDIDNRVLNSREIFKENLEKSIKEQIQLNYADEMKQAQKFLKRADSFLNSSLVSPLDKEKILALKKEVNGFVKVRQELNAAIRVRGQVIQRAGVQIRTNDFVKKMKQVKHISNDMLKLFQIKLSQAYFDNLLGIKRLKELFKESSRKTISKLAFLGFALTFVEASAEAKQAQDAVQIENRVLDSPLDYFMLSDEAKCIALENQELKETVIDRIQMTGDILISVINNDENIPSATNNPEVINHNTTNEINSAQGFKNIFKNSTTGL